MSNELVKDPISSELAVMTSKEEDLEMAYVEATVVL
jgi:hypothetical protein